MKNEDLKKLETILLDHCYNMSILRRDAPTKKKDSILDSLIAAIIRSNTSIEELESCIIDVNNNNVINLDVFVNGGNIEKYINPKWLNLSKALWRQRSVGLGTPNAASGEGELMFIFLSPKIKKPTRGDLSINGQIVELKGEGVRVNGKVSGKKFRIETLKVCDKYKLSPNIANIRNQQLNAVEIEKHQHQQHWLNELNKLSISDRKLFIADYMECVDGNKHNVDELFTPDFNYTLFKNYITKTLYKSMFNDRAFDKFVMLGDGSNIKILSTVDKFNENVDNGTIHVGSDYFRINQDAGIGWYIS